MACPKRRTSHSRKHKRRATKHLRPVTYSLCSNCNQPRIPYHVCPQCGFYKNRAVLKV